MVDKIDANLEVIREYHRIRGVGVGGGLIEGDIRVGAKMVEWGTYQP